MKRSSEGQALLARYRQAIAPSDDQLSDVHTRLTQTHRRRKAPWVLGLTVAVAAAAGLVLWWALNATSVTARRDDAPTQAPHESRPAESDGRWNNAPPSAPDTKPALRAPRVPAPAASPPPREPVTPKTPKTATPPSADAPGPRLAEEAKLIHTAEAHLRTGDTSKALTALGRHAREFPDGELGVERRALRSIALCKAGKRAQGRGEAASLRQDPASHPYRERIAKACK